MVLLNTKLYIVGGGTSESVKMYINEIQCMIKKIELIFMLQCIPKTFGLVHVIIYPQQINNSDPLYLLYLFNF